ncbi:hypothetical protein E4G67_03000 [Candidatus Bathyarchaeota archaeon]|nr:MAG: hypothetical protein E4G67_03000 [Candidatus Bathyarchaeota archaeon]
MPPLNSMKAFIHEDFDSNAFNSVLLLENTFTTAVQVISGDPQLAGATGGLVIFLVLGILAYANLFYLIKRQTASVWQAQGHFREVNLDAL